MDEIRTCYLIGGPNHGTVYKTPTLQNRIRVTQAPELPRGARARTPIPFRFGHYVYSGVLTFHPETGRRLVSRDAAKFVFYEWAGWIN